MFKNFLIIMLLSIYSLSSIQNTKAVWDDEWDDILNTPKIEFNTNTDDTDNAQIDTQRWVWDNSMKEKLLNITQNDVVKNSSSDWLTSLQSIIVWIKDTLVGFLLIIAVAVFLYIWIKISFARWNPEEFKKAWMHLVYAVIWIFIVSIAWAAVTLIAWLNI